jgi:hypothetical protein
MLWLVEKLASPFSKLIEQAAKRKVDELATTLAVRQSVLREIVRLHFDMYVRCGKLDHDRAIGLSQRVFQDLQPKFDLVKIDPESEQIRAAVQRSVTIKALNLDRWVQLNALKQVGEFNPNNAITVDFRDANGNSHHSSSLIFGLQQDFLFHAPLSILDPRRAKVAGEVSDMVDERLKGEPVEVTSSVIGEGVSAIWGTAPSADRATEWTG